MKNDNKIDDNRIHNDDRGRVYSPNTSTSEHVAANQSQSNAEEVITQTQNDSQEQTLSHANRSEADFTAVQETAENKSKGDNKNNLEGAEHIQQQSNISIHTSIIDSSHANTRSELEQASSQDFQTSFDYKDEDDERLIRYRTNPIFTTEWTPYSQSHSRPSSSSGT